VLHVSPTHLNFDRKCLTDELREISNYTYMFSSVPRTLTSEHCFLVLKAPLISCAVYCYSRQRLASAEFLLLLNVMFYY
jgi:hypothetical protein